MRHCKLPGILAATLGAATSCVFAGQQVTPIVLEGDSIAGVGAVNFINNIAVNNDGHWFVEVDTDFSNTDEDVVLLDPNGVFLREGFGGLSAPPGVIIDSFDSVTLNDLGIGGFNHFIDPLPGDQDSGVYLGTTLAIQESDISTSPDFSAGTVYTGFLDVKINDNNDLLVVASVDDPAISSTTDRALVIVSGATETVIAKEGDVPPGQTEAVTDFGTGPHQSAFNDMGDVFYFVDLGGATSTDDGVLYLNSTIIAQEGSPSPVAGRNYEFLSSRGIGLNNNGSTVFKANLTGDSADDEVIIVDGAVFKREGEAPPVPGSFALTSFGTGSGPVHISDNGRVLWFGDWDDPNTDVDTGLFLDDQLLVQEGVTTVGGVVVDAISSGADAFFISDNGEWVIFEATLVGGVDGAFLINVQNPADLDGDGDVDGADLAALLSQWGGPGTADLNGDGVVNGADLAQLLAAWTG